jgi:ectoine hydroxylase-related dioxygenase (phytanoyl-CoA dioxygenase family)
MEKEQQLKDEGFTIIESVYNATEIENLITIIATATAKKANSLTFRKHEDLFAIRQFINEVPETLPGIFNTKLKEIISKFLGDDFFIIKSIYFDKPEKSNWFVSYHQDLTISVLKKEVTEGYEKWTVKDKQFAVQPPTTILENNFTIRIHLDDTTGHNGALKVIKGSHSKGIQKIENIVSQIDKEQVCEVKKGGMMIMKPLLFHASNKTTNNQFKI